MKKLIGAGLLLLVGCRSSSSTTTTSTTPTPASSTASSTSTARPAAGGVGAATPNDAIATMMAAVKAGDLQAFGTVWGTTQGPAREQWDRNEYEMRAYYTMKCLRNDSYSITANEAALNGGRVLVVELKKGAVVAATKFEMVVGPGGKWFMKGFDPVPLTKICQAA